MANRALERVRRRDVARSTYEDDYDRPLVAAGQPLLGASREQYALQYKTWQDELWAYTRSVGEYGSAMDWFANGISRMHLVAAKLGPGQREPDVVIDGPAAELVNDFVQNAKGGETQFLHKWGTQLAVPGVGYFCAWEREDGSRVYDCKSAKTIERSAVPLKDESGQPIRDEFGAPLYRFRMRVAPDVWTLLPDSSLVGRIFKPDPEYDYEPTSPSQSALTTLRELDLFNRHIVATLLSRLAFNGLLLIPSEVTLPVNPQFKDAPDPFIAELIEIARRGIKDPGSPGSAIPLPLRVPAEFVDKFVHLIVSAGVTQETLDGRDRAVKRLTEQLPVPPEALTGTGDMNHWNAWHSDESTVKMYFGPPMEILCGGFTEIFLRPMLRAMGKSDADDGSRYIVWYDPSDLTADPDTLESDTGARDRLVISDTFYRERLGLTEKDAPSDEEARIMILRNAALNGLDLKESYYLLYPKDKPEEPPTAAGQGAPPAGAPAGGEVGRTGPSTGQLPAGSTPTGGTPADRGQPPPAVQPKRAAAPTRGA